MKKKELHPIKPSNATSKTKKSLLHNPIIKTAISPASIILAEMAKPVTDMVVDMIKDKTIYSVNVSGHFWSIAPACFKYFKGLEPNLYVDVFDDFEPIRYEAEHYNAYMNKGTYAYIYNGTPILLIVNIKDSDAVYNRTSIKMQTLRTEHHIYQMKEFIRKLVIETIQYRKEYMLKVDRVFKLRGSDCYSIDTKLRTFDDVFVPETDKRTIMDAINAYIGKREWYAKNRLPNHFGILLYGEPGTGKGSIAQAITNEINGELYVMNGDDLPYLGDIIERNFHGNPNIPGTYRVLQIDDIDTGVAALSRSLYKKNEDDDNTKISGLGEVLNVIDGVGSPTNIIYIMTTNHKDKLDPALIRPGRCDIQIEMKYVCYETLKRFMYRYFPDGVYEVPHNIKPGITFATLQTQVMMGKSVQEIIDFVKGE